MESATPAKPAPFIVPEARTAPKPQGDRTQRPAPPVAQPHPSPLAELDDDIPEGCIEEGPANPILTASATPPDDSPLADSVRVSGAEATKLLKQLANLIGEPNSGFSVEAAVRVDDLLNHLKGVGGSPLPKAVSVANLVSNPPPKPPVLIEGLLRVGSLGLISAPSKARKTYNLLNLAVAVATGDLWMGRKCMAGPVLFLNYELEAWAVADRVEDACRKRGIPVPPDFHVLNLESRVCDLKKDAPAIVARAREIGAVLIVIDPAYMGLGDRDENKAGDVRSFLQEIKDIARAADASAFASHHFAKGNAGAKNKGDKASGSGTWTRYPALIMEMTPQYDPKTKADIEGAFTVESTLRYFPPLPAYAVRWNNETDSFVHDAELDPKNMKGAEVANAGRVKPGPYDKIIRTLGPAGIMGPEEIYRKGNISKDGWDFGFRTLNARLSEGVKLGLFEKEPGNTGRYANLLKGADEIPQPRWPEPDEAVKPPTEGGAESTMKRRAKAPKSIKRTASK